MSFSTICSLVPLLIESLTRKNCNLNLKNKQRKHLQFSRSSALDSLSEVKPWIRISNFPYSIFLLYHHHLNPAFPLSFLWIEETQHHKEYKALQGFVSQQQNFVSIGKRESQILFEELRQSSWSKSFPSFTDIISILRSGWSLILGTKRKPILPLFLMKKGNKFEIMKGNSPREKQNLFELSRCILIVWQYTAWISGQKLWELEFIIVKSTATQLY